METTPKLGELITGEAHRDAIHVAVAPVVASEELTAGQDVGLLSGDVAGPCERPIGIVDPFIKTSVGKGERFYLFLYPNTVTGMRHEWQHPAFGGPVQADAGDVAESEKWLRNYAIKLKPYDADNSQEYAFTELIRELKAGELFGHGSDLHGLYELDDADELKFHAERYLGIRICWEHFTFSCSC